MAKKKIPDGKVECDACGGKGVCVYSCCTGEIVRDDYCTCPECHEHLGEETCQSCNGEGVVDDLFDDYPDTAPSLQAKAELLMDIQKGHVADSPAPCKAY